MSALSDPENVRFEVITPDDDPPPDGLTDAQVDLVMNAPGGTTPNLLDALRVPPTPPVESPDVATEDSVVNEDALVAAAGDVHTGAMIALVPSMDDLDRLVLTDGEPGAEPRDELHLTLAYLGDAADISDVARHDVVMDLMYLLGEIHATTVDGLVFGANMWNPIGDEPSWVLAVGQPAPEDGAPQSTTLTEMHDLVEAVLQRNGDTLDVPPQHVPWIPHICLAYTRDTSVLSALLDRMGPVTFDHVRVAFGGIGVDIPLLSPPAQPPDETPSSPL